MTDLWFMIIGYYYDYNDSGEALIGDCSLMLTMKQLLLVNSHAS